MQWREWKIDIALEPYIRPEPFTPFYVRLCKMNWLMCISAMVPSWVVHKNTNKHMSCNVRNLHKLHHNSSPIHPIHILFRSFAFVQSSRCILNNCWCSPLKILTHVCLFWPDWLLYYSEWKNNIRSPLYITLRQMARIY